jgi:hypothetical protein
VRAPAPSACEQERARGRSARRPPDGVEDCHEIFGQQVEEVPAISESDEPLFDDPKEWVQRLEVVEVVIAVITLP